MGPTNISRRLACCLVICFCVSQCGGGAGDTATITLTVCEELDDSLAYSIGVNAPQLAHRVDDVTVEVVGSVERRTEIRVAMNRAGYRLEQVLVLSLDRHDEPVLHVSARSVELASGTTWVARDLVGVGRIRFAAGRVDSPLPRNSSAVQVLDYDITGSMSGSPWKISTSIRLPWSL